MADATIEALIAALEGVPSRVEALAQRAAGSERAQPGAESALGPGEWSGPEIAGHLCDAARVWGGRMRVVAFEEQPQLPAYDENGEVLLGGYRYTALADLVREFRLVSERNVALLRGLPTAAWERTGHHAERGSMTLREIVTVEAEHEQMHAGQLARALGLPAEP